MNISDHQTLSCLVETVRDMVLELETQQPKQKHDQVHTSMSATKKTRVAGFYQERERVIDLVSIMDELIGVFVKFLFPDVLDTSRSITIVGTIVRGSRGYVLFAVSQAMLRFIVLWEWMGWFWIQRLQLRSHQMDDIGHLESQESGLIWRYLQFDCMPLVTSEFLGMSL